MKQLDVRKNLVKKDKRASVDSVLMERRKSFAELKAQRLAERERQKERAKEARLNRARELREKRKMEKLEQLEKMKPREDELCEDSKVHSRHIMKTLLSVVYIIIAPSIGSSHACII